MGTSSRNIGRGLNLENRLEKLMLRAAIFDMDGVIVDSHPVHKKSWRKFLKLQGKEIDEEDLNFIMDGRKREDILRHFLGELSDEQVRVLGHQKQQLFREEAADIKAIEGLYDFLQQLSEAEIKLAVASSGSESRVNYVLDSFHLRHYFEAIVTGDQVTTGKTDPTIFRVACDHLRVRPSETLVFEDSVSGVRAAKAAGMRCVGVATNGVIGILVAAGADHIIPDFSGVSFDLMQELFE
jgi:beta-phosphoglucomutase family hydrolase